MIQCTHCGTKNREGSKFCSDCGARLVQQSGLICPMCGTPNTVENVFCSKCGARLVPLTVAPQQEKTPPPTPIKGLSLPSKPSEPTPPPPKSEPSARAPKETPAPPQPPASDWLSRLRDLAPEEESPAPRAEAETPAPAQESPAPRAKAEAPTAEESSDWLARLRDLAPEEESPAPRAEAETPAPAQESPAPRAEVETPAEESSDWLARLRDTAPAEEAPVELARRAAQVVTVAEEDLPDWLRGPTEPTEAPSAPSAEERAPNWLTPVSEEPPVAAAPIADEVPDWLKDTGAPSVTADQAAPPPDRLDWFKPVQAPPDLPPPIQATEEEIPEWLKSLKPQEPSVEPQAPAVESPSEALLEALEAQASVIPSVEKPAWLTESAQVEPSDEEFLPDWLRTPPPVETPAEAIPEVAPEFAGQVPDWIAALKPVEQPVPGVVTSGTLETTGALAGLRGVLPLASAVAEPHAVQPPAPAHPFQEQARLFESVLSAPVVAPAPPKPKRRAWSPRPFIYLLLLAVILVPFFVPDLGSASLRTFGTPTAELYDAIQALPPNALVVVAFDYDPGSAGEMDLQANALVRHLMQRRARVLAISTLDTGPQIAQRVLDAAARAVGNATYGTHYLNLGYIAGQEAGLRQMALAGLAPTMRDYSNQQPLDKYAAFSPAQSWRNVALVVELAGSPEVLQYWMEQVQPRAGVKMAAGVSAAVEPRARAYRDAKQLTAFMGGLIGAAQYEILSNQRGLAVISVGAQSTANVALIALIVLGNLVYWFTRQRGEAK
jgi:hypothetical protein